MRLGLIAVLASALAASAAAPLAQTAVAPGALQPGRDDALIKDGADLSKGLSAARDLLRGDKAAEAYTALDKLLLDPRLRPGVFNVRSQIRDLYFEAALATGHDREAREHLIAFTDEPVTPADWRRRLNKQIDLGDFDAAIQTVEVYPKAPLAEFNAAFNGYALRRIYAGAANLPNASERRLALMNTLIDSNWRPTSWPSEVWAAHAGILLAQGDYKRANNALQAIGSARVIAGLRADRRFDAVVTALPGRFAVATWLENEVKAAQVRIDRSPSSFGNNIDMMSALLEAGRYQEAVTFGDKVLANLAKKDGKPVYADAILYRSGVYAYRAHALMRLGRVDEALSMMREMGHEVDLTFYAYAHPVLISGFYLSLAHWSEAVAEAGLITNDPTTSTFSKQLNQRVLVCAYDRLGDKQASDRALDAVRQEERTYPSGLEFALLCTGRDEEAAALFVRRLKEPADRVAALGEVQLFQPAPAAAPFEKEMQQRYQAMAARPAVRQAIETVGRRSRVDMPIALLPRSS